MNNIEEEKGLFGTVDVSLGRPSSSETTTQSHVKSCATTVQEGVEPIQCCQNTRFAEKNHVNEVVVEENSDMNDREKKRFKMSDPVDSPTTYTPEESSSSRLDRPESELAKSFCFKSVIEQKVPSKDVISGEAAESGSLDESLLRCLEKGKSVSAIDGRLVSHNSNGGRNELHDVQIRQVNPEENLDITENNEVVNIISIACAVGNNILEEKCDVINVTTSTNEAHNAKSDEESKFVSISSGDETERNTDPCLLQLDELTNIASKSANLADRASCSSTERKLLVLDVNGLLVSICSYVPYDYDPDDIILRKAVFKRPYCDDFLRFCFEKFNVGIWTSKTKRNMEPIIDFLFGNDKQKLLFCWDQSHCSETGYATVEKKHKPILLKKLKKLWEKYNPDLPWKKGEYNETNTLLIDDSPYKALCNPQYTAVFPYTYHFRRMNDYSLGPAGDLHVYLEGLAMAENVQEYVKQNPFGQRPITERNLSWRYYLRVIEASTTPPRHADDDTCNSENPL